MGAGAPTPSPPSPSGWSGAPSSSATSCPSSNSSWSHLHFLTGFGDPLLGAGRHSGTHTSTTSHAECDSGERTSGTEPS
eukprot:8016457-Alexandrium_andersonii.AAC.1